ncbi:MAG: hypothetical protein KF708_19485 [Pirellulales bacterium]|nr:hypothetical protein [Pirellulales bacterium]
MSPRTSGLPRPRTSSARRSRAGMTFVELMTAMVLMATTTAIVATLALAMREGWQHNAGHATAAQHARVALERISRAVSTASANEFNPGLQVVYETVGSERYPDTLVVWNPPGDPVSPEGMPRISECIFYCPDPAAPHRLLEITAPNDNRTIPLTETLNSTTWRNTLNALKNAGTSKKTVLTDLLRTASPTSSGAKRGCVRFMADMRPTQTDWYNSSLDWSALPWPQHLFGPATGMRQSWVRIELQLVPDDFSNDDPTAQSVIPFYGSAVLNYTLYRYTR